VKACNDICADQPLNPIIHRRRRGADLLAQLAERKSVVALQQGKQLSVDFVEMIHAESFPQLRASFISANAVRNKRRPQSEIAAATLGAKFSLYFRL
jgi:hypothetical protein